MNLRHNLHSIQISKKFTILERIQAIFVRLKRKLANSFWTASHRIGGHGCPSHSEPFASFSGFPTSSGCGGHRCASHSGTAFHHFQRPARRLSVPDIGVHESGCPPFHHSLGFYVVRMWRSPMCITSRRPIFFSFRIPHVAWMWWPWTAPSLDHGV